MSEHSLSLRLKVLHTLKLACYCDSLARVSRRDNPLHFPKLINVLIRVRLGWVNIECCTITFYNTCTHRIHTPSLHPHFNILTAHTTRFATKVYSRRNAPLNRDISVMLRPVWVSAESDNHVRFHKRVTHSHRHCKASVPLKSFQVILTVRQDVFSPFVHTTSSLSVMGCIEPWEFDTSHLRPPVPRKTTHLRAIILIGDTA